MKTLQFLPLIVLMTILLTFSSCTDDKCDQVFCPTGYICDQGTCIDDPTLGPCDTVNCPSGFSCVDGNCIENDACDNVVCPDGQICVNGDCLEDNGTIVVSGQLTQATTWTSNNIYELAGKVIVNEGITLTIEAGTIIKGRTGTGTLASALVVARGGVIMAEGTVDRPIIMTTILDDIKPGQVVGSNSREDITGQWGGLIILGRAPISPSVGQEDNIEGIPADEEYGLYGGSNPEDNSGVITYLSVRHGGSLIGDGNEINGITLGGVGSGTIINNIEVIANEDDGIEFFGGTVNVTNALILGQKDDALDIDQAYSGTIDNALVIQSAASDSALEIDGPEGSENSTGKFTITNSTFIGAPGSSGKDRGATLKSKAQGTISNCQWSGEFNSFLRIRESFDQNNACADKSDAYDNLITGDLSITNSDFVTSQGLNDVIIVYLDEDPEQPTCAANITESILNQAQDQITANNNNITTVSTHGADISKFQDWTWASNKGKL